MQKCINGWTKEKMLEVIKARPFEEGARDMTDRCVYLHENGNKCGVGLFIPDGHEGQQFLEEADELLERYPDLKKHMPLDNMQNFQKIHDKNHFDAKTKMIEWVMDNVED
jgi:hypothetical protein